MAQYGKQVNVKVPFGFLHSSQNDKPARVPTSLHLIQNQIHSEQLINYHEGETRPKHNWHCQKAQTERDRMLRAASPWQEVSIKNNKNSFLPDLGREEESMTTKGSFLWTLQAVLSSSLSDPAGRGSGSCAFTEWGKLPMPTLCWETLWLGRKRGRETQASFQLIFPAVWPCYLTSSEHQFCLLWNGTVTLDRWLGRLKASECKHILQWQVSYWRT